MRLKVLAPLAVAATALGIGAAVVAASPAQAAWVDCNTYTVDDNTRVKGDCYIYSGQARVWGECDWSILLIRSGWTQGLGYQYPKTGGTCWYGVEAHGFDARD
jgi:hypothetical protein